jgi:hypothetical protein
MCSLRWNGAMAAENLAPASPSAQLPVASDLSPLQRPAVRDLIFSRAATTLGESNVSYGATVLLAQEGAAPFVASLARATRALPAVRCDRQGGIVAGSVAKRTALDFGNAAQAALVVLLVSASMLGQSIAPATKASVVVVATGLGKAVGSAVLAPLLTTVRGIQPGWCVSTRERDPKARLRAVPCRSRPPGAGA